MPGSKIDAMTRNDYDVWCAEKTFVNSQPAL